MEEKQAQLTEEQHIAKLFAEQAAAASAYPAAPAPATIPTRSARPRKRSPYRQGALLVAGVACYILLIILAALAWGSLVFLRQGDVGEAAVMPLAIFLGAVFLSCCFVTALSRGGTIFPALGLAVIVNILPFLLGEAPQPQFKAIAIKLLCTLAVAIAGFVISKLLYMRSRG